MMKTTAIVLHFRTIDRTHACLISLQAAGVKSIIVIDNSEDGGVSLAQLRLRLARSIDDISIFIQPKNNLGFGAAINLALAERGPDDESAVLLINSDARISRSALCAMVETLKRGVAMTAPMIREAGQILPPVRHYHPRLGLILQRSTRGSKPYLTGACLLLTPAVIRSDLFDTGFFFYGEDVELSARLRDEGHELRPTDSACIEHDGSASARKGSLFYEYHLNRAHWLLARKLFPHSSFDRAIAILGRCVTLPCRAVTRSIRGRSAVPIYAAVLATWDTATGQIRRMTPVMTTERN